MTLSVRAELNNLFNRIRIPVPSNSMLLPAAYDANGNLTSGFGSTSTYINAGGQRSGQLVARFNF